MPAPLTDPEAALGVNAFARLQLPQLRVPISLSNDFVSWQLAGYSSLTSAIERHDSLVGPTREFLIVASVLTAALIVGVCRRLRLGWFSTALAVVLSGVPAVAALLRIVSVPAAVATFWITLAALAALAAADRHALRATGSPHHALPTGRRPARGPDRLWARGVSWLMVALSAAAAVVGILSSEVAILLVLGLVLAAVGGSRMFRERRPGVWVFAVVILSMSIVGAFWVTAWEPALRGGDVGSVELTGVVLPSGGLIVAAACSLIGRLRPIALGVIPILLAAAWPSRAQAAALVLGLTVVAILIAGLLDELLRQRRRSPEALVGTVTLVTVVAIGLFIVPLPASTAGTVTPSGEVATWIETQLVADAVIQVDRLSRAQLVRDGLDPAQLSTPTEAAREADFVLAPLYAGVDYPLIARFGSGSTALGLRLVVPDSAAYTEALLEDEATRGLFGAALAANPNLILSTAAAASLRAGDVDARLMLGLAGASSSARFTITRFPGTIGDLDSGNILRHVILTDVTDLGPTGNGQQAPRRLAEYFQSQLPPYRPIVVLEVGDTLTIRYPAPSPLGLLP